MFKDFTVPPIAPAARRLMLVLAGSLIAHVAVAQTPATAPAPPTIDVRLMDKTEADRSRGCTVAIWQANRNPDADRYATLFIEQLIGPNHVRQPARIKVGDQFLSIRRVAVGGKTSGYGLYEFQLYKLPGEDEYAILELKLGPIEGEAVDIEGGSLTIVMRGRQHFRGVVKGGAGCMTAPIAAPVAGGAPPRGPQQPAAPAAPRVETAALSRTPAPRTFRRYEVRPRQLSRGFLESVRKAHGCDPAHVTRVGVVGFQMSEESAIWEIPCQSFAYQASSVIALVYLPSPADNLSFAAFGYPRGRARDQSPAVLMSPSWDVARRTVTSVSLGRAAGDCGTLERHRVLEDGSFELVELRVKTACDGKAVKPEEFPLVYQAR
jgi:hypothetical protein